MIARAKLNLGDSDVVEKIREKMIEEHDGYYGTPCGASRVIAWDGRSYPCGYSENSDGTTFRWVTSGGNLLEIRDSILDRSVVVIGRRHGIPWQFFTDRFHCKLQWDLIESRSDEPPYNAGNGDFIG
jgi:hypothetical protein